MWDIITKTVIPVLAAMLGVVIASVLNIFGERRRGKKKLANIKKILLEELAENYRTIIYLMPPGCGIQQIDTAVRFLSCSVYDAYIGSLCDLEAPELQKIYNAYFMIRQSKSGRGGYMLFLSAEEVMQFIEKTGSAVAEAIELFDEGEQLLKKIESVMQKGVNGT